MDNFKNKFFKLFCSCGIIIFFSCSVLLPLMTLFIKAFKNDNGKFIGINNFIEYLKNPVTFSSITNSLKVSITVTLIAVVLAFLFSYSINRTNLKGKLIFKSIALLPLFMPTMTHGISLIYLFGRQGIITKKLGISLPIYGFLGIVIAEIIFVFPVLFFMLLLAFDSEDYRKYEVANIMGIGKIKQFFTITLPNIKYSLMSCLFAGFTLSFSDFGAPKVIGGNFNVLSTDIFKQVIGQQNFSMGATIGIILIIPALLTFIIDVLIKTKSSIVDSNASKYRINENKIRDLFFSSYTVLISLFILILFGVVIIASLVTQWPYDMSISLNSYSFSVMGESIWLIFNNSIYVSFLSALFGTIICFFTAYLVEREKNFKPIRKLGYFLSIIPNALPGLTIGLAYIFFFNSQDNLLNFLYGSFGIIMIANIVHFFSTPFLTIISRLKKLDNEYETISNIMGVSWFRTIFKVIIPLSLDSILESFSYYFINSMITISAVIFLYTSKTRLVSIMMIYKNDSGDIGIAAAIAVMIVITNIIFKVSFDVLIKYIRRRNYYKKRKDKMEKEIKGEKLLEIGKEILIVLNEISSENNVKYWLEFGTLLGKIRENNFIDYDVNFNIGIMQEELNPNFIIELEKNKFKRIDSLSLDGKLKYLKYIFKEIEIEIFLFERNNNKVICYSPSKNKDEIVYNVLSDTTLREVNFMGVNTRIPRNSIKRLIEIYGHNYNIPNANWSDEMSPSRRVKCIKKIKD